MKTNTLLKIILLMILTITFVFGQSKTEEAKKKLDKNKNESGKQKDNDNNDDDYDDDYEDEDGFTDILFSAFSKRFICVSFNIPYMFNEEDSASQFVSYNKYPYQQFRNNSFRTSLIENKLYRFQLQFALGHNSKDNISTQAIRATAHYKSWAFRLNYKYLKELKAPYPIQNMLFMIERKSRAFSAMDMGFSAGYNLIRIDNDIYNGFTMGYNIEIYPVKPVSIVFNPIVTFYEGQTIISTIAGINFHFQHYFIGFDYNIYKIAGIEFNHAQIKIGRFL